ncbi:MAG TPA: hypothetical protein VE978_18140 [Chitinophagales bacterium]|nr:hypothetical protein [Chitinophagales bacterium]
MSTSGNVAAVFAKEKIDLLYSSVLKTLLYYDLFRYPLTAEEIKSHCSYPDCSMRAVQEALDELSEQELLFRYDQFYSLQNDRELFLRRIRGNEAVSQTMSKAQRRSKLIASFPFVRCVCISGSFSKNYFDETTDLDFFIIAEPNRLWICRTLLILFKKIFLLNSKKFFCVNYFIDSAHLRIPDKNIFTATEIITLLPMYNYDMYLDFVSQNDWMKSFFPNGHVRKENGVIKVSDSFVKRFTEKILSGKTGEWLDTFFYRQTLNHWKKKFGWQPQNEFELNMRTRKTVSKHHPQGFQFQVLKKYEERIREFENEHDLTLN